MDKKSLNEKQYEAVSTASQYTRVIAGAGSGKTRVLTYRLAYLVSENNVSPYSILAITFTNKVAKEMRDRLQNLLPEYHRNLQIMTFHGFCYRFLRSEIHHLGFPTSFTIIDEDEQRKLVKDIAKEMGYTARDEIIKEAMGYIGKKKCNGKYPEDISQTNFLFKGEKVLLDIFQAYEDRKNAMFLLDFDDLLLLAIKILGNHPQVRQKWQSRYQHILIDEFQDTNNIEDYLVNLLLTPTTSLYVVGDPDQTIYTWRGANQSILLDMNKKFKAETIILEQNYRSTKTILDAANKLISHNKKRVKKNLFTLKEGSGQINYMKAFRAEDEAEWIASEINHLQRREDFDFRKIAVLYRANYLTLPLEKVFNKHRIPYKIFGGLRFYQRKEIKDLLAYFRLLANKKDDISFERIINVPRRGIGDKALQDLKDEASECRKSLFEYVESVDIQESALKKKIIIVKDMVELLNTTKARINDNQEIFSEILQDLVTKIGYFEYLRYFDEDGYDERVSNIHSLFDDILSFVKDNPDGGFDEYLQNIALLSSQDDMEDGEFVSLMTIHTAKGLEFPLVFVMGVNEGVFPSLRNLEESGHDGLEEERRLCYVAFTRAMEQLFLSCNCEYSYVLGSPKIPSRFLKEAGIIVRNKYDNYYKYEDETEDDHAEVTAFEIPETKQEFDWRAGDSLLHKVFGKGIVKEVIDDKVIKVVFEQAGEKLLLANHASITKIKEGESDT